MPEPYLSVIIPAYNEEERIAGTLKSVSDYLQRQPFWSEILVVDDGSFDNTVKIVGELGRQISNLRLIGEKENKGKGYAVRQGMLEAKGQIRLFMDADNSTEISCFEKMKPFFESGYGVVIGSRSRRDAPETQVEVHQRGYKEFLGRLGNSYIRLLAVPGIWDTQTGFKAFNAEAAGKIFKRAKVNRWAFDVEVLALAGLFNFKIAIVPIFWKNDPRSRVRLKSYLSTLWEVLKIRYNLARGTYSRL